MSKFLDGIQQIQHIRKSVKEQLTFNVSAPATSGAATITITPPPGEIWRIKVLTAHMPIITGGASGDHALYATLGEINNGRSWLTTVSAAYSTVCTLSDKKLTDEYIVSENVPLVLFYANTSNVAVTSKTMEVYIVKEVEYVG